MVNGYAYVTHHDNDVSIVHFDHGQAFGKTLCGERTEWSTSFGWTFPDCQRCAVLAGLVESGD